MNIKMIGLDLDRTTLASNHEMSERTENTLKKVAEKGVHVVIATGRSFYSMPPSVHRIDGIEYTVNSNGAEIRELKTGKKVYTDYLDREEVVKIVEFLRKKNFSVEFFNDGKAYINTDQYERVREGKAQRRARDYVLETRNPVPDVYDFALEHKDAIENINVFFDTDEEKEKTWEEAKLFKNVTLTSSLPDNIEFGGLTTSKANALLHIAEELGVKKEEIMCCGDSLNDREMLLMAGFPVAVANACKEIKEIAAYETDTNDNDGVAKALEKFILNEE